MSAIMLKVLVPVLLLMTLPVSEGFFGTNMYLLQDTMRLTMTKCGVILDSVKLICMKSPPPACQTFNELSAFCQDMIGKCTQKYMNPKLCYPPFEGLNPYWSSTTPNTFLFMRSFDLNDVQVYEYLCRLICVNQPTPLCDVLIWLIADARRLNGIPGQSSCVSPGDGNTDPAEVTTDPATTEDPTTEGPTDEPTTEGPTDGPTDEPTTEGPTDEPTTEGPTDGPTDEPTTEGPTDEPTTEWPTDEPTTEGPTDPPTIEEPCTDSCDRRCDREDRKEGSCPEGRTCCKKDCCSVFRVM